jgi:Asp-tRNA(Asn)/Glu-tRNA(Gln) amidotransferase A subunit family amidase
MMAIGATDESIQGICTKIRNRQITVRSLVEEALEKEQQYHSRGAYLHLNENALKEAEVLDKLGPPADPLKRPLHGIPISVKDLFDCANQPTTCGSGFYASTRPIPKSDSRYVAAWKRTGAVIIGKTHLNEFAYGLTGENRTFGPCTQPLFPERLAGGSSSGAAASVQSSSAYIGLGTDTGGSIRVPSALCGLVGFRHTVSPKYTKGMFPLAPSYDTCGWIQRHLGDLPFCYSALTCKPIPKPQSGLYRIAFLTGDWLASCESNIQKVYIELSEALRPLCRTVDFHPMPIFCNAPKIFSALQSFEVVNVHKQYMQQRAHDYDPVIRERLEKGLALTNEEYALHQWNRHLLVSQIQSLWKDYDFLFAPACPFTKLMVAECQDARRGELLQLTTPFSLAGLPVLTFPWGNTEMIFGWQVAAPQKEEIKLIELAHNLSQWL